VKQGRVVECVHVCNNVLHYSVEAQSRSSLLCCCDDVDLHVTLKAVHVTMLM
jgi:hypothetical protein